MSLGYLKSLQGQYYEQQERAEERMREGGPQFSSALSEWKDASKRLAATNYLIYLELNPGLTDDDRITGFLVALP